MMPSNIDLPKDAAILGDIMIDWRLTGKVERISPEAPVPVLMHTHGREVAGDRAKVVVNLIALGCDVRLVGVVGDDQTAEDLKGIPKRAGISTAGLVTDKSRS
jgi:bifunctional ADP-heptose synthase (sugar kinase/adenylyltransferase)